MDNRTPLPYFIKNNGSTDSLPRLDGRNCSVLVLSFNRAQKTINLLESFFATHQRFMGELIVLDQASEESEFELLSEYHRNSKNQFELHRGNTNLGVARGRNLLASRAKRDWLIFLDNDLIITESLFIGLHTTFVNKSAAIINFTIRNYDGTARARRGYFCINRETIPYSLTVNPIDVQSVDGETSTHRIIYGGAFAVLRNVFEILGRFDEMYFVGLEDYDFALRANQMGLKIETCSSGVLEPAKSLDNPTDVTYAESRFSKEKLLESSKYFEDKWGIQAWSSESENWLVEKRRVFGLDDTTSPDKQTMITSLEYSGPKLLLVTDVEDWAFHRIAEQWIAALSNDYLVEVVHWSDVKDFLGAKDVRETEMLDTFMQAFTDFEIAHFFWIGILMNSDRKLLEKWKHKISFSIYDHYSLEHPEFRMLVELMPDRFHVSSEKLREQVAKVIKGDVEVLSDGVDTNFFRHMKRSLPKKDQAIRVGWVGNSAFGGSDALDRKGFYRVFLPTLNLLREEGWNIEVMIANKAVRKVDFKDMPQFYENIDVLICTSPLEGTPNPVLEAISSGVPIISTDVGIVWDSLGALGRTFVLDSSASPFDFSIKFSELFNDAEIYEKFSSENASVRSKIDWKSRFGTIQKYVESIIPTDRMKTKFCLLPFTTPSIEPDGSVRLCSSSSIFPYRDETNMGSLANKSGLLDVWTSTKYVEVRKGLLGLEPMKPYCRNCDYRRSSPTWVLKYHLALQQYWRNSRDSDVLAIIDKYKSLHSSYEHELSMHNTSPLPMASISLGQTSSKKRNSLDNLLSGEQLAVNVDFNTLNRCNVGCIMCPPSIKIEDLGWERDELFVLDEETFDSITRGVQLNSSHFVGAYAEPLINKDLPKLIRRAKDKGSFTAITTNAMLLSQELGQVLLDSGLDMISVSIHGGTKEVAERVMRRSNFDLVRANLLKFKEIRRSRRSDVLTYFNFVGMTVNIRDFGSLIDLCDEVNFENINLFSLIAGDQVVNRDLSLENDVDLLRESVIPHLKRASALGINVLISSPYKELLSQS